MNKNKSNKTSKLEKVSKTNSAFLLWLSSRQAEWIGLLLIVCLGGALRFYDSLNPVLWFDELVAIQRSGGQFGEKFASEHFKMDIFVGNPINPSSIATSKPISEVWSLHEDGDLHPPLHCTILQIFRHVFGDAPLAVRLPSLLPSIASVLLVFLITKILFDTIAAYWASLLMSLTSPQVIYALEVRGYALLTFLGLSALYILVKIEKSGPSMARSAWLGIFSFCLAFTHYFSFGLLLAMGLYTAIRFRGKTLLYTLAGFAFGGVIFLAAWGPQMWNQFFGPSLKFNKYDTFRQNAEIAKQIPDLVAGWFERLFFHLPNEFVTRPPETLLIYFLPAVAIFWRKNLLLPWLWLIFTMGFVALLDMSRDTFHFTQIRYTLLAAPAVYIIVAAGIVNGKFKWIYNSILPAILSIFLFINIPKIYTPYKERWVEIPDLIKDKGNTNETIILPHAGQSFQVYWPRFIWQAICYYIYDPNRPMIIPTKPLSQEAMSQIGWGKDAWVITRFPEFQQANSLNWATYWVPGCEVKEAWLAQAGATVFHIKLPEAPSQ